MYNPSDVLISPREPYDKNTLWIHPHDGIVDIKIFDKGWKILSSTKDEGLSEESTKLVNTAIESLRKDILKLMRKYLRRYSGDHLLIFSKYKELKDKIDDLNSQIEKLSKRITKLRSDGNK